MTKPLLTAKGAKLFALLRELEANEKQLSRKDFAQLVHSRTEHSLKSWDTYRSKYLDGKVIFPSTTDVVLLCVRNSVAMSEADFANVITQSKADLDLPKRITQESWLEKLRRLIAIGETQNFRIPHEDRRRLSRLFERQQALDL